jgi:predicted  nucleic acid-binding Zn-ribbon protein
MNDELLALVQLQETDQGIARLRGEIAALPKRLAALEEKLVRQKAAVELAEKSLKEEDAKRRRMESDLKDQQQKIIKFREQSSSVKTNEQYHALQHEIGFAETEIRKIEDRELESMERSEQLETQLRTSKQELTDHSKVVELEKEAARVASEEQQKHLAALLEDQGRYRTQVEERLLANYDRISKGKGQRWRGSRASAAWPARWACARNCGTRFAPASCCPARAADGCSISIRSMRR